MQSAPKEVDWEQLVLIGAGHTAFQLLWAGLELRLFDELSARPQLSLDDLAESLGLKAYPLRVVLIGLVALGILVVRDERYSNATLIEARMVRGKPGFVGGILGWQAHIVYPGMMDFVQSVRESRNVGLERFAGTESSLYERLTHDKFLENIFQDSMTGLSNQANHFLPKAVDFGQFKHVVDAGGGVGTNAMAIARAYPGLRTSVFDSASVCALAEEVIQKEGLSERVGTWAGNFFDTPFPQDVDCIVYCHILTIWSTERNLTLLKRTYDALPQGGKVVIFNMMGNDDDSGPLATALGSPYFLAIATGEGMLHPWKDYEIALRGAGFKAIERLQEGLPIDHGILVGTK